MGTVESADIETPVETTQTVAETTAETAVTTQTEAPVTYSTTLNVSNIGKPRFADYTDTLTPIAAITETSLEVTTAPDIEAVIETYEITTTTAETTTPATTTTEAATTTTTVTTTVPPETVLSEESTLPIEDDEEDIVEDETEDTNNDDELVADEDAENDEEAEDESNTLSVLYNGNIVTGDEVSIISRVTMAEIGGQFNEEAIKAQAIAAYTYVKYYNDNGTNATVAMSTPNSRVTRCVEEIIGKAIYYNNSLIQSVYCSSTPGYTASSYNVWGVDYPYLQSRFCELDEEYDQNYGVKTNFSSSEIKERVLDTIGIELDGDPADWFEIKTHVDNVFVGNMTVGGQSTYNNGTRDVTITGRVFRETIMSFNIKSACFEIEYNESTDEFTITTYGYGHGVGFVQYGANNLANVYGYDYNQILEYYFPGTTVK